MSKRRKVLLILGLLLVGAVCFGMLRPRDEPKYKGKYLNEWMAAHRDASDQYPTDFDKLEEAQRAVRAIGTNALPYFLKWMRHGPSPWRGSLYRKLPSWLADNRAVKRLIAGATWDGYGYYGLRILGTNAVSAIPELEAMMRDRTKPRCAHFAIVALLDLGEPAIPTFQAVLADPHQADRNKILVGIGVMAHAIGTNKCLPTFVAALTNDDALVRNAATNIVSRIAPELLTNAPAP